MNTTTLTEHLLLQDHVDARPVAAEPDAAADRNSIVRLDPDHPGFRDEECRARRNRIARIALKSLSQRSGDSAPARAATAAYTVAADGRTKRGEPGRTVSEGCTLYEDDEPEAFLAASMSAGGADPSFRRPKRHRPCAGRGLFPGSMNTRPLV